MSKKAEPLRGEAAYRESKRLVEERNEAARAKGLAKRAKRDAEAAGKAVAAERKEMKSLPKQPKRKKVKRATKPK